MTNLAEHVTSLEISKKLKALGFKQNSLFYWASFQNHSQPNNLDWPIVYTEIICEHDIQDYRERNYLKKLEFYSAYTASELILLALSDFNINCIKLISPIYSKDDNRWYCSCHSNHIFSDENPADCVAKLVIENKLMEVPK